MREQQCLPKRFVLLRGPCGGLLASLFLGGFALFSDTLPHAPSLSQIHDRVDAGEPELEVSGVRTGAFFDGSQVHYFEGPTTSRLIPDAPNRVHGAQKPGGDPSLPSPRAAVLGLSEATKRAIENSPNDSFHVIVTLTTQSVTNVALEDVEIANIGGDRAKREELLGPKRHARADEIARLQEPLRAFLATRPVVNVGSFWSQNQLEVITDADTVRALAGHPDVQSVSLNLPMVPHGEPEWDGADVRAPGGLNLGVLVAAGADGDGSQSLRGRATRIAIIDSGFNVFNPAFRDGSSAMTRLIGQASDGQAQLEQVAWNCDNNPCIKYFPDENGHGLVVSGIAAGDFEDGQSTCFAGNPEIGTALERSGAAPEAELILLFHTDIAGWKRAVQKARELNADIIVGTWGGGSDCDGLAEGDMHLDVFNAVQEGRLFVHSAGNLWNDTTCNLAGPAEALSMFTVGGVGTSCTECTSSNYSSCPLMHASGSTYGTSRGGITVSTVRSGTIVEGATGIAAVVPAAPAYVLNNTCSTWGCGAATSWAAPLMGGAAAVVLDNFLIQNQPLMADGRRLFTALLAMTDRQSAVGKLARGFDPHWGGGRFQARLLNAADEIGFWFWESTYFDMRDSDRILYSVNGPAAEPSTIQHLKTVAAWFEPDPQNIGDIDISVKDLNCSGATLGSDQSYDTKAMVRLDSIAANKQLCVELYAYSIPPGETRRVYLFTYYTGATSMR